MRSWPAAAVVVVFVLAVVARAEPQERAAQSQPQARAASPGADVQAMGVSLDRIRRQLRETPPSTVISLARVQYHVEVVGKAPRLDFFKDFDIGKVSAVQYGGMTHAEFLHITAPPWRKW